MCCRVLGGGGFYFNGLVGRGGVAGQPQTTHTKLVVGLSAFLFVCSSGSSLYFSPLSTLSIFSHTVAPAFSIQPLPSPSCSLEFPSVQDNSTDSGGAAEAAGHPSSLPVPVGYSHRQRQLLYVQQRLPVGHSDGVWALRGIAKGIYKREENILFRRYE